MVKNGMIREGSRISRRHCRGNAAAEKRRFRGLLCILLSLILVLALAGCGSSGKPSGPDESSGSSKEKESSESTAEEEEEPEENEKRMHGPDAPTEGMRYDEWKKIEYSEETTFDIVSFCVLKMSDGSRAEDNGYRLDPEEIYGSLTISEVTAEPVGGEMKLRSGGYVDIKITTHWTGDFRAIHDDSYPDKLSSFFYQDNGFKPFDVYTGTSLFNYSGEGGGEGISGGEASDSGFIESDVTWNGRIYRVFAREDSRNAGASNYDIDWDSTTTTTSLTGNQETVYTFRVPADYDGLALLLDPDIFDEREYELSDTAEILASSDLYADILTDDRGEQHDPKEFVFVKVSDLLENEQFKQN